MVVKMTRKYEDGEVPMPSNSNPPPIINYYTQLILNQIDQKRDDIYLEFKEKLTEYADTFKQQVMRSHFELLQRDDNKKQINKPLYETYLDESEVIMEYLNDIEAKVATMPLSVEFQQLQLQFLQTEKINHYVVGDSFRCQHCNDKFFSLELLQAHLINEKVDSFVCKICGRQFKSQHHFETHHQSQHSFKVECTKCTNSFSTELDAYIHFDVCHGAQYSNKMCIYCHPPTNQRYTDPKTLRKHIMLHHEKQVRKEFERYKRNGGQARYFQTEGNQ